MPKKKIVSIVGTGVIGAGWAARFLANGYIVKAYDPNKQSLDQLKINVKTAFKSLRKVGLNKNASLSKSVAPISINLILITIRGTDFYENAFLSHSVAPISIIMHFF